MGHPTLPLPQLTLRAQLTWLVLVTLKPSHLSAHCLLSMLYLHSLCPIRTRHPRFVCHDHPRSQKGAWHKGGLNLLPEREEGRREGEETEREGRGGWKGSGGRREGKMEEKERREIEKGGEGKEGWRKEGES